MNKRKYKIVEEKLPNEEYSRYYPKVAHVISRSGEILGESDFYWETITVPDGRYTRSYAKTLEDAEEAIEQHERFKKELDGDYIVREIEYTPN